MAGDEDIGLRSGIQLVVWDFHRRREFIMAGSRKRCVTEA